MEVTVGQQVLVPDPSGGGPIRAEVVGIGEKAEGFPLLRADGQPQRDAHGEPIIRDVVWVQYHDGELDGSTARVHYDALQPVE
jgi:hypothetical protein